MSRRPRRTHSAAIKAKMALAAVRGDTTLPELAQQHDVHSNQITDWKKNQLLSRGRHDERKAMIDRTRPLLIGAKPGS